VAAVDDKHQIIVDAQAHGTGSEQELLLPVVEAIAPYLHDASLITADAGYHSEANLKKLAEMEIDALIADNQMRQRDERFVEQDKHKAKPHPLHDKRPTKPESKFGPKDFQYDPATNTCICPAGQALYSNGNQCTTNGRVHHKFQGAKSVLRPLYITRQVLAPSGSNAYSAGNVLCKESGVAAETHRADEAAHRF